MKLSQQLELLTPQEVEIARLVRKQRIWRTTGLVFGLLSLANVPLTLQVLPNTNFFQSNFSQSVELLILGYTVISSIPFLLFAFACVGNALSYKRAAASVRRAHQSN